jgi:hypothetical protein
MTKTLQESANRILKGYMNDMSSSSGEESDKEATPKKVRRRAGVATPTGGRTTPSGLRVRNKNNSCYVIIYKKIEYFRILLNFDPRPLRAADLVCPPQHHCPPVDQGGLGGQRIFHHRPPQSTTWMVSSHIQILSFANVHFLSHLVFLNRSSSKSQIPSPRSVSRIPKRPGSTTPGASPRTTPATLKRAAHPPRAQSVDPYRMASQSLSSSSTSLLRSLNSASRIKRPESSRYKLRMQNTLL